MLDTPGPSNSLEGNPASPFGFPEKEVISFINSCNLSESEARDFMLFLTFANQLNKSTSEEDEAEAGAAAIVGLVNQLNCASKSRLPPRPPKPVKEISHENTASASSSNSTKSAVGLDLGVMGHKLSFGKHNDIRFYPSIICVICKEWVCSRSRRIHIGAHFDYRKYKCSMCDFSHSKEIFVSAHMRRNHTGPRPVLQKDDPEIEEKIENVCKESIAMTRDLLSGKCDGKSYTNYMTLNAARSQIPNKERRSRTKVLTTVTDASNRQLML
ncbi:unnamed protein product [Heligmosomoides polygyrus]|uniref:C2H2-type domain-containing protein n=1 Tax=Heligmosomoides polygyrus TaxID=6339 RepID=A0A183FEJ9_HELPZ|nr:unnamed protein product [Heligmosomoides polygyrus]